jgi:tetratricopeptide (TPR) repeat protein
LSFAALMAIVLALVGGAPRVAAARDRSAVAGAPAAAADGRARSDLEEDDDQPAPGWSRSLVSGRRSGLFSTLLLGLVFYFVFMRGRGAAAGGGWGSYYLFWMVVPALLALVSDHPAVLGLVVVGFLARRWLPDPFLWIKYWGRIRTLEYEVNANPGNVTARRDLAAIWLEKRRPLRALPLLEQALARDPESTELLYLRGVCQLLARQYEPAVATLVELVTRDPRARYGEPYLRAADALIALQRWDDAEEALERFLQINSSNVEAHYKQARIRRARKDREGAARAVRELRQVWRSLPPFQRRNQIGWYVRALFV